MEENPTGLQHLIYKHGGLAYNGNKPIRTYLRQNAWKISREHGVSTLLEAHPDKKIILNVFEKPTQKPQKEDLLDFETKVATSAKSIILLPKDDEKIAQLQATLRTFIFVLLAGGFLYFLQKK